jgi:hypothetical protein
MKKNKKRKFCAKPVDTISGCIAQYRLQRIVPESRPGTHATVGGKVALFQVPLEKGKSAVRRRRKVAGLF